MIYVVDDPKLERPPRFRNAPVGANCADAEFGIELVQNYIISPYDWQADILRCWLARNDDGKYACQTDGLLVPRQNGKTKAVLAGRMMIGAIFYGEKIRYSAHRVDTMTEMFDLFIDLFGDPRINEDLWQYPELAKLVKKRSCKNGDLKIKFFNGAVIYFVARSRGSGRGYTVDVNIFDEAQYMTDEDLASSLPAQSASPSANPAVIYAGTPPDYEETDGEVFGRVRENGINGVPTVSWHEWSVDEVGDVGDRSRWYETNPNLGRSLLEIAVENEYLSFAPLKFAIERLGYWPDVSLAKIINIARWRSLAVDTPIDAPDKMAIGVKFVPSGQVCVATAAMKAGTVNVELSINADTDEGIEDIVKRIAAVKSRCAFIAIDGKSGAGELEERLLKAGVPRAAVGQMGPKDAATAATMLVNGINEKTITHITNSVLDASAENAEKRKIGSDGYGFGGDSCPVEAAAAAVWAVRTTTREPGKKVRLL